MKTFLKQSMRVAILTAMVCLSLLAGQTARAQGPTTATGWQADFASESSTTWDGADQDFSYQASNGTTYWCFGDTVIGTNSSTGALNAGWTMVGDTVLIEHNGSFTAATPSYPSIPNNVNGDRYWADGMFEANGYFYVLGLEVTPNSVLVGTRLAKFQVQSNATLNYIGMVSTPNTDNPGNGDGAANALYANDALVVGQYVYVYGSANTGNQYSPLQDYVARIPTGSIENPSAWTYWNGSLWVTGLANAAPILNDGITSARYVGTSWVLTHKPFGEYSPNVYAEVGNNPYGPWSETLLFSAPNDSGQPTGQNYVTYYPQFHPEKWLSSGKLLFSVASAGATWNDEFANADIYKPLFFECSLAISSNWAANTPYNLICKTSGQALDNAGSTAAGTKVTQYSQMQGNINQHWTFNSLGNGYYNIISVRSGMALDNGSSESAGAAVTQYTLMSGNTNQQWQIVSVGGGYYNLVCKTSGMTLDNTGSASAGAVITQYTIMPGNPNQAWQIVPAR